jgi:FKBP-type peptidyl-prolyl cis-trans isomerase
MRAAPVSMFVLMIVMMVGCGGSEQAKPDETTTEMKPLAQDSPAAKPEEAAQAADPLAAPDDVAAPPPNADRTPSGLASRVLVAGTGAARPTAESRVKVHYTGWTTDGAMFDSSVARGTPIEFPLSAVIPGWREGVMLMVAGEKRRLWIPGSLAYDGKPGRPQGTLVFDVELIEIVE